MKKIPFFAIILISLISFNSAFAQFGEPDVDDKVKPRSLFEEGYKTGFGFNISLSDFGLGVGGQFRFGLAKYTEAQVTLKVSGLKDPTEQTFVDYFGGRTVPEKYRRAISVPLYVGLKKRFFAQDISDNFRLYGSLSGGPVFVWSFAYFRDLNENGFRENDNRIYGFVEPVNDIFSGWNESDTHWGLGGEFVVGIDFGDNFANLSSVQFGYTVNYFKNGIQMLQPFEPDRSSFNPVYDENGNIIDYDYDMIPANDPSKFFGSAQISFVFGWMW